MNYLSGKHILLTRTAKQNIATAPLLSDYKAIPVHFPCLDITYLKASIDSGLKKLEQKHTHADVIFSSSNGVLAVASCLDNFAGTFKKIRLVAVGRKTADALINLGCSVEIIPDEASQEGLIQTYKTKMLPKHVYFFRAEEGSDVLENYFKSEQVDFTFIPAYRSRCNPKQFPEVISQMNKQSIDAVLLGSAKTAAFYVQKIGNITVANQPTVAVMSQHVAEAADKLGLDVQVIAKKPSFKAMLDGLNQYFTEQHKKGT